MSAYAPFNPAGPAPVTEHSARLDRIRDRERALIEERAYTQHDRTCSRGEKCYNRERHTLRDYVWRERDKRSTELEAEISDLHVAIAILKRMR